jgi:preprotein translocase subunit SecE
MNLKVKKAKTTKASRMAVDRKETRRLRKKVNARGWWTNWPDKVQAISSVASLFASTAIAILVIWIAYQQYKTTELQQKLEYAKSAAVIIGSPVYGGVLGSDPKGQILPDFIRLKVVSGDAEILNATLFATVQLSLPDDPTDWQYQMGPHCYILMAGMYDYNSHANKLIVNKIGKALISKALGRTWINVRPVLRVSQVTVAVTYADALGQRQNMFLGMENTGNYEGKLLTKYFRATSFDYDAILNDDKNTILEGGIDKVLPDGSPRVLANARYSRPGIYTDGNGVQHKIAGYKDCTRFFRSPG